MSRVCPNCKDDYRNAFEIKILRCLTCGHPCCTKCLTEKASARLSLMAKNVLWVEPTQQIKCPMCGLLTTVTDWEDTTEEENFFEKEAGIRSRVLSILNSDRLSFQSSPEYNRFLEEREEIVFDLAFSQDEAIRKARNEYLRHYELENQQRILEACERQRRKESDRIKDIVDVEGVFYEQVKQVYQSGFVVNRAKNKMVHPLQREYPQLFNEKEAFVSEPLKGQVSQSIGGQGILNQLHAHLPKTIIPQLEYVAFTAQCAQLRHSKPRIESNVLRESGGHRKEKVFERTRLEVIAGFRA